MLISFSRFITTPTDLTIISNESEVSFDISTAMLIVFLNFSRLVDISFDCSLETSASFLISSATTENHLPYSPA
ncbi:MAG TPA: hypothetical protein P5322_09860 [Spirochaetota bacterium]|nr:hypothetical protein [Spirochaetota bacterium]